MPAGCRRSLKRIRQSGNTPVTPRYGARTQERGRLAGIAPDPAAAAKSMPALLNASRPNSDIIAAVAQTNGRRDSRLSAAA